MTTKDRSLRHTPRWLLAMAALLAAGLVTAMVAVFWPTTDDAGARAQVAAVARQTLTNFTTYDYRHLAADISRTSEDLNPSFKAKYNTTMKQISPKLTQYKATSSGTILDFAVESVTSRSAVAIAFVDQTISNSAATKPHLDHLRMSLSLVKVDGEWLASAVNLK